MLKLTKEQRIADYLLRNTAVTLNTNHPFIWPDGIKSPINCDIQKLLKNQEAHEYVIQLLKKLLADKFEKIEAIGCVATDNIPIESIINDKNGLIACSVNSENQISSSNIKDKRLVLIKDSISTGKSSVNAVSILRNAGAKVIGLVSVFSYGFESTKKLLEEERIENHNLCNLETLSKIAVRHNYISGEELIPVMSFAYDPKTWSEKHNRASK